MWCTSKAASREVREREETRRGCGETGTDAWARDGAERKRVRPKRRWGESRRGDGGRSRCVGTGGRMQEGLWRSAGDAKTWIGRGGSKRSNRTLSLVTLYNTIYNGFTQERTDARQSEGEWNGGGEGDRDGDDDANAAGVGVCGGGVGALQNEESMQSCGVVIVTSS